MRTTPQGGGHGPSHTQCLPGGAAHHLTERAGALGLPASFVPRGGEPTSLIGPDPTPAVRLLVRRHGPTFVRGHVEGKGVYRIVAEDYAGEGAVDAMIDSGAAVSCCSLEDTKSLRYDPREIGRTARAAGGALLEPLGVAKLNLCFGDGGTAGSVGGIWPWPIGGRGHFFRRGQKCLVRGLFCYRRRTCDRAYDLRPHNSDGGETGPLRHTDDGTRSGPAWDHGTCDTAAPAREQHWGYHHALSETKPTSTRRGASWKRRAGGQCGTSAVRNQRPRRAALYRARPYT